MSVSSSSLFQFLYNTTVFTTRIPIPFSFVRTYYAQDDTSIAELFTSILSQSWECYAWSFLAFLLLLFVYAMYQTRKYEEREALFIQQNLALLAHAAANAKRISGSSPTTQHLTALITGANSGIGFTLAELLAKCGLRVIIGCRNKARGEEAVKKILSLYPRADIRLLLLDVSSPISVLQAVTQLKTDPAMGLVGAPSSSSSSRASTKVDTSACHLDYLVLNAGIMPVERYRWSVILKTILTGNLPCFLESSRPTLDSLSFLQNPVDEVLPNTGGAPSMFATHVLGHLLLVNELQDIMQEVKKQENSGSGSHAEEGEKEGSSNKGSGAAAATAAARRSSSNSTRRRKSISSPSSAADVASSSSSSSSSSSLVGSLSPNRLGRVIWTGSRSSTGAQTDWQQLTPPSRQTLNAHATAIRSGFETQLAQVAGGTRGGPLFPMDTYGQAKYAQELLNVTLARTLTTPTNIICPGFVKTDLTPAFFNMGVPFLALIRKYAPSMTLTGLRGTAAHIAVMVAPHEQLVACPDRKLVLTCDKLLPAVHGSPVLYVADQVRMWKFCTEWMEVWKKIATTAQKSL